MRLSGMAEAFAAQLKDQDIRNLSFEERFGLIVDQEWTCRQDHRLKRLLRGATLRLPACVEDIDYQQPRGLDRSVLHALAGGGYLRGHQNVLVEGPTGVGKTFIACALANAACRQGFSARYYRLPRLLSELTTARGDGSYPRLLSSLPIPVNPSTRSGGSRPAVPSESVHLFRREAVHPAHPGAAATG